MSMTLHDILMEEMMEELHHEKVMRNATLEQCIYLFVEGHSEEETFKDLLENTGFDLDLERDGIVIANYNGIGNLANTIRLLHNTLSHDRPIVVTYDDDKNGKTAIKDVEYPKTINFKIPYRPIVNFSDGSQGGSFEEAFDSSDFKDACFREGVLRSCFTGSLGGFELVFDERKEWYNQLKKYVKNCGGDPDSINKVMLAKNMVELCNPVPETFFELAKLLVELREKNPIQHPDGV